MSSDINIDHKMNTVDRLIRSWLFYHLIFWTVIVASFFIDLMELARHDFSRYLVTILTRVTLLATCVYVNLILLIPRYFKRKKYITYSILLLIVIVLFSLLYSNVYFVSPDKLLNASSPVRVFDFMSNVFTAIRYILISALFEILRQSIEQERKITSIQLDKAVTEMNYLRAKVNPHFLFNTLNNIYGLALQKSDKTPEIVLRLSDMMEYMISEDNDVKVPLEKELNNLSNYIEIERIRQGNDAQIDFLIEGDPASKKIVPLILLPILENAVKHGINKSVSYAFIDAKIEITDDTITFKVENNQGKKSDQNNDTIRNGMGLNNLKKRLQLFYPNKHKLELYNEPKRFYAQLTLKVG